MTSKFWSGVLVGSAIVTAYFLGSVGPSDREVAAQSKKPKLNENIVGVVPTEYGNLSGIAGGPKNMVLAFTNDKGEVAIVEYRGIKISDQVFKIHREY